MSETATPHVTPDVAPGFGLHRIGQLAVVVRDPERALRFYRDTLGMRLLFQAPPDLAFFDCGGVRVMLSRAERPDEAAASSIVYYDVPDIHAAHDALAARGVAFEQAPHVVARLGARDLWMAFFRDSEQNLLALMSEVPRPPD